MFAVSGCENLLETKDYLNKNNENFPATESDLQASLGAIYQSMAKNQEWSTFMVSDIISDDRFAGGGANDIHVHGMDQMKKPSDNWFSSSWANDYEGIFRANKILESIDKVTKFTSETSKNQVLAEAYFMRAFFYFDLVRLFGDVPLIITSESVNIPRTPAKEVYARIGADLKKAIELFPSDNFNDISKNSLGHATKWAAEGMIARMFLFYTGYYKANDLVLAEGGTLTKDQVVAYLGDCINNSGHELASDFRELWPYTNDLTVEEYNYTKGKGLKWLAETGSNEETVFAIKFGSTGWWGNSYHNSMALAYSLRGQTNYANVFPFGEGWGFGTINSRMVSQWKQEEPNDTLRLMASVLDIYDPKEGIVNYEDAGWEQMNETHLWQKKYISINTWRNKETREVYNFTIPMFGAYDGSYINNTQDLVLIRFADILLMHSELTQTNTGLNKVRQRVGLAPIAYSLEALQKERHHEMAFEGSRYYDLLRWFGKEAGAIIDANQNGVLVLNNLKSTATNYELTKRINETGGLLPIPNSEILLSGGILKQTVGWEGNDILLQ